MHVDVTWLGYYMALVSVFYISLRGSQRGTIRRTANARGWR
jgi:hypothetical protein